MISPQVGASGSLDTFGTANLTGITYDGSNADLLALANAATGINVLSFQFVPAGSLASLAPSYNQTSLAGSITHSPLTEAPQCF